MRRHVPLVVLALVTSAVGVAVSDPHADRDARPDVQIAVESAPAPRCERVTRLIGQDRGALDRVMKQRGLRPVKLELVVLPPDVGVPAATTALVTVELRDREVRGIYANLSGDGCVRPDHRHAVDRDGNLYQFDGPAGVVDYDRSRCHTARGWQHCNLQGQTRVLYVVTDPRAHLAGVFGSNLAFIPLP